VTPGWVDDGDSLNLIEICAELVSRHKLKPAEIEQLDRWWIYYVYFHARGKYGELKVAPKRKREAIKTGRDAFAAACKTHGWEDWLVDAAWERAKAEAKAKKKST
jgi:hypothetical protein